jgi:hypothetical protein
MRPDCQMVIVAFAATGPGCSANKPRSFAEAGKRWRDSLAAWALPLRARLNASTHAQELAHWLQSARVERWLDSPPSVAGRTNHRGRTARPLRAVTRIHVMRAKPADLRGFGSLLSAYHSCGLLHASLSQTLDVGLELIGTFQEATACAWAPRIVPSSIRPAPAKLSLLTVPLNAERHAVSH